MIRSGAPGRVHGLAVVIVIALVTVASAPSRGQTGPPKTVELTLGAGQTQAELRPVCAGESSACLIVVRITP